MKTNELMQEEASLFQTLKNRLDPSTIYHNKYPFYCERLEDNLYLPLSHQHYQEFLQGDGNELNVNGLIPPKMNAVFSSSALCYNAFAWMNQTPLIYKGEVFHLLGFEYKLKVLQDKKTRSGETNQVNANLDAVLRSKNRIVYVESKFLEWLHNGNKTKTILQAYLKEERYLIPNPGMSLFQAAFQQQFQYYDYQQMLKHLLVIVSEIWLHSERYHDVQEVILLNLSWHFDGTLPQIAAIQQVYDEEAKQANERLSLLAEELSKILNCSIRVIYCTYQEIMNDQGLVIEEQARKYFMNRYFI